MLRFTDPECTEAVELSAEFDLASPAGAVVKIRGDDTGTGNIDIAETSPADGSTPTISVPLPPFEAEKIDLLDLNIRWYISIDGGQSWLHNDMISRHRVYVTHKAPVSPNSDYKLFHTVVHIGCEKAKDEKDPDLAVEKIWNYFAGLEVFKVGNSTSLKYYGDYNAHPDPPNTTSGLLNAGDGRCGAWALFLHNIIKAQGIPNYAYMVINIKPLSNLSPDRFWIKNQDISETPPNPPKSTPGIKGQGVTADPWNDSFGNHAVVANTMHGSVYDPSYGEVSSSLTQWQIASVVVIRYLYSDGTYTYNINSGSNWPCQVLYTFWIP